MVAIIRVNGAIGEIRRSGGVVTLSWSLPGMEGSPPPNWAFPAASSVVSVDLTGHQDVLSLVEALCQLPSLAELTLDRSNASDDDIERLLRTHHDIEHLSVRDVTLTGKAFTRETALPNLKYLWLSGTDITSECREWVLSSPRLIMLDLVGSRLPRLESKDISTLTKINRLSLDGFQIDPSFIATCLEFQNIESLSCINCSTVPSEDRPAIARPLGKPPAALNTTLHRVSVAGTRGALAQVLEPLQYAANLYDLGIDGCVIDASVIEAIQPLAKLKQLTLSESTVDDAGISELSCLGNLQYLDISRSRAGNLGLDFLTRTQALRVFTAAGCQIRQDGFARIGQLSHLEALDLSGSNLSDDVAPMAIRSPNLSSLRARGTAISSITAVQLLALPKIRTADLHHTNVDQTILPAIRSSRTIEDIDLTATSIKRRDTASITQGRIINVKVDD
ncbi:MAG: hypothetical protein IT428_26820 [Planctomycetaceae bacterium]|nr:hypothetical protein [Planctomycetaceae bacterium]